MHINIHVYANTTWYKIINISIIHATISIIHFRCSSDIDKNIFLWTMIEKKLYYPLPSALDGYSSLRADTGRIHLQLCNKNITSSYFYMLLWIFLPQFVTCKHYIGLVIFCCIWFLYVLNNAYQSICKGDKVWHNIYIHHISWHYQMFSLHQKEHLAMNYD